jgi:hypothetical protein
MRKTGSRPRPGVEGRVGSVLFLFGCFGLGGFVQVAHFIEELIVRLSKFELIQSVPGRRGHLYARLLVLFHHPNPFFLLNEESHPFDKLTRYSNL